MAETLSTNFVVLMAIMTGLWLIATARRDVSIVDPYWGTGFIIVAWLTLRQQSPASSRVWLMAIMTTIWGLRLSLFLLWRNWGHDEDKRYVAMRLKHGPRFWWVSLFSVFLLQGLILWFVALPIQATGVRNDSAPLHWIDAAGVALWAVGLFFETVGDRQLARFKADPANAGKVMDRGLWRWTRHPNYFGDFCVWWGLYLVAFAGGAYWTIVSPLLMTFLLMKVSGVSLLESTISERRPDYADYKKRTSPFFPRPPKTIPDP